MIHTYWNAFSHFAKQISSNSTIIIMYSTLYTKEFQQRQYAALLSSHRHENRLKLILINIDKKGNKITEPFNY